MRQPILRGRVAAMTNPVSVYQTRSEVAATLVSGLLQRNDIEVSTTRQLLGAIFPGSRFGGIVLTVGVRNKERAHKLIVAHEDEIQAHLSRVEKEYVVLESRLCYSFRDRGLLEQALTHSSRAQEKETIGGDDNESLEFLGDAVLGLVIADRLYRDCPDYDEGQKSKLKAQLVSATTLAKIGVNLDLGNYLLFGRGEAKSGGRKKPSLVANAVEALIAAVYLDGSYDAAAALISHLFAGELVRVRRGGASAIGIEDFKSSLQERLQAEGRPLPEYALTSTAGPEHDKSFTIELRLDESIVSQGQGRTKKEAEQAAAQKALARLADSSTTTSE